MLPLLFGTTIDRVVCSYVGEKHQGITIEWVMRSYEGGKHPGITTDWAMRSYEGEKHPGITWNKNKSLEVLDFADYLVQLSSPHPVAQ